MSPASRFAAAMLAAAAPPTSHVATPPVGSPVVEAQPLLDTAIARLGGAARLRAVRAVRLDLMTQWLRLAFDPTPFADGPGYEWHTELRDYALPGWRNTRRFVAGGAWRESIDVVRDSVAIRRRSLGGSGGVASPAVVPAGAWAPLNVAYIDERREAFAFAPERLLLAMRDAVDLRREPDTSIAGVRHARVAATVAGYPTTLFLRQTDRLPAMVRFRAAEPNDFGLVPYGTMTVERWYSEWRRQPNGLAYPTQWDERRLGRPYTRTSVLSVDFAPAVAADSFAVSDSLRAAFFATTSRPMHDLPLDSARLVAPRLADFNTPGAPVGAVKLGPGWVLLEAGQAPLNAERAVAWLQAHDAGAPVTAAVVTAPLSAHDGGGVAWLAGTHTPVYTGPGGRPYLDATLRGYAGQLVRGGGRGSVTTVRAGGRWLRAGGDSLWVGALDLTDARGSLLVYEPSLEWLYVGPAVLPLQRDEALASARARGWAVAQIGSLRTVAAPLAPGLAPVRAATPSGGAR